MDLTGRALRELRHLGQVVHGVDILIVLSDKKHALLVLGPVLGFLHDADAVQALGRLGDDDHSIGLLKYGLGGIILNPVGQVTEDVVRHVPGEGKDQQGGDLLLGQRTVPRVHQVDIGAHLKAVIAQVLRRNSMGFKQFGNL